MDCCQSCNLHYQAQTQLTEAKLKLDRACDQLLQLYRHETELQCRYDRALTAGSKAFRYSLRLKLTTVAGIKLMVYQYATSQAERVDSLTSQIQAHTDSMLEEQMDES